MSFKIILKGFTPKHYQKNEMIALENESCSHAGFILSGAIWIFADSAFGKESVYKVLKENDVFGNNLIYSITPYYKGNIIAKEETEIVFLSKKQLESLMKSNNEFLQEYLSYLARNTVYLNQRIKLLSIENADERFLFYLSCHSGCLKYSSISDLASILSLKRETVSRAIHRLEKKRVISIDKKTIEKV